MACTIELPGIIYIMPYAVQASYDRRFRGHERIAQPYGEDSILLSDSLTGSDFPDFLSPLFNSLAAGTGTVATSDKPSRSKLESTAYQRNQRHQEEQSYRQFAMDYRLCCHSYCKSQSEGPYIERKIGLAQKLPMHPGSKIAHQPCTQARSNQQRKDLRHDHAEGFPEPRAGLWMYHRNHKRHQ